jgi:cell shape-determining protein MreC
MMKKHFDRVYLFAWVAAMIRRYKGKYEIMRAIEQRYKSVCDKNENIYRDNRDIIKGVNKFRHGIKEFLQDFQKLEHHEIELLKEMTPLESLSFPIKTIGKQKIKLTEV